MKLRKLFSALLCLVLLAGMVPAFTAQAEPDWQSLEYWIGVDIRNERTTIYRTSDNSVVHCWICSTGANGRTPRGVFYLPEAKGSERKEWFSFTNSYVKYAVRYTRGLYFHSLIYHRCGDSSPTVTSVHNLGHAVSHGCVRLQLPAIRWLCYNCPTNTKVIIHKGVDDPLIVEALGHEASIEKTDTSNLPGSVKAVNVTADGPTDLTLGQTVRLTASIEPSNTYTTLTWKTNKKKVATVSADGLVTAVGQGTAKVTVSSANGKSCTTIINVTDPGMPARVMLDQTGTVIVPVGSTLTLHATLSPASAYSDLRWTTSKARVATVEGGVVTARAKGSATIKVFTRNKKAAKVKIKVVDPYTPASVALDRTGVVMLKPGETLQLNASVAPDTAVIGELIWKSSKSKVATVSPDGLVTAVKKGSATITVRTRNGKKAKVKIKVVE